MLLFICYCWISCSNFAHCHFWLLCQGTHCILIQTFRLQSSMSSNISLRKKLWVHVTIPATGLQHIFCCCGFSIERILLFVSNCLGTKVFSLLNACTPSLCVVLSPFSSDTFCSQQNDQQYNFGKNVWKLLKIMQNVWFYSSKGKRFYIIKNKS